MQVSDSLRSSKESHRPPTLVTHSQEVQVNFLAEEEVKMEVEMPPQVTLVDLSDKVTTLVEQVKRLSLESSSGLHRGGTFAVQDDPEEIQPKGKPARAKTRAQNRGRAKP